MRHRIVFWANAGRGTGYGHFIRSLALADMLKDNFECIFFTAHPSDYQRKEAEDVCRLVNLDPGPDSEERFLDSLNGDEIVVLDNYFFTSGFQKRIKDLGCRLVVIDEMHDKHYFADAIISPCLEDWSVFDAEPGTAVCLGPDWALLRRPFRTELPRNGEREGTVICFGGSDPLDLCGKVAAMLKGSGPLTAVTGDAYRGSLPEGVKELRNLSAGQLAALFSKAAKVYCSASGVCYEALACGAEVHAGYYVDNQKEFYGILASKGLICPMGDLSRGISDCCPGTNPISFSCKTDNFIRLFTGLSMDCINFTELSETQSRQVWKTRNLPGIRRWMTNPEPFGFESHERFIDSLREDSTRLHFAFFDGDDFVGTYNFNGISDSAERGLYVNPAYQKKGAASAMETLLDNMIKRKGVARLRAEVLKDNARSISFHRKAGYEITGENERFYLLSKTLI